MVTGVMLMQQVLSGITIFYSTEIIDKKADVRLMQIIHDKVKALPAQLFEDKDRLDDIEKAGAGRWGSISMFKSVIDVTFNYGMYLITMGMFLWSLEPILLVSFFFIFTPVALSQLVEAKYFAQLEEASAPLRRQNSHYEDCLIGAKHVKETRLCGAYFYFKKLFMDSLSLLAQKEWDTRKKISAIHLGLNFSKALGWVGVLGLLFRALIQGNITVGAFAAVFGSVEMMFNRFEGLFSSFSYSISHNLGKIHNMLNLLDMPNYKEADNSEPDLTQGIVATNVSFAYPAAGKNAVDDISLTICSGETLALVGENGSGKTTLVKLLCGLYKPDTGQVIIGGCDSAKTSDSALFSKTSGVFQNFHQYVFSLEENVLISDIKSVIDPVSAMVDANVDYQDTATFPDGLTTKLSREFEGVELSGGQWQRIATARGLYRHHHFIVLDEPTAAIDPLEESRIYKHFTEITKGKIAILVTHRLGSARIADRIAVMEGGKIVEIGTHESLLASNGKYAEMWAVQAESYNIN